MTKKIVALVLLSLLLWAWACRAVVLGWDQDPGLGVTGYNLYQGTSQYIYTKRMDVGNATQATVSGLVEGQTYYFVVSSYTPFFESSFSPVLTYRVPVVLIETGQYRTDLRTNAPGSGAVDHKGVWHPFPPVTTNLVLTNILITAPTALSAWTLQVSKNLRDWQTYATGAGAVSVSVPVATSGPVQQYFRLLY